MQITKRDIEVLRWINSHGAVDISHVAAYLGITDKVAYRRMKKLVDEGLIWYTRFYYEQPGVYRVSQDGIKLSKDTLPALRKISKATLDHDLMVTTISQYLLQKYQAKFVTERQLRQQLGYKGVGQNVHVSDGKLILPDKTVAIEVELTLKGRARRDSILARYMTNFDYDEIWYFCRSGSVYKAIKNFESVSQMFKVNELETFLIEVQEKAHVA